MSPSWSKSAFLSQSVSVPRWLPLSALLTVKSMFLEQQPLPKESSSTIRLLCLFQPQLHCPWTLSRMHQTHSQPRTSAAVLSPGRSVFSPSIFMLDFLASFRSQRGLPWWPHSNTKLMATHQSPYFVLFKNTCNITCCIYLSSIWLSLSIHNLLSSNSGKVEPSLLPCWQVPGHHRGVDVCSVGVC